MHENIWVETLLYLMFVLLGFCLGLMFVECIANETKEVQVEAVERGFADWRISDEGDIEFQWKRF